MEDFYFNVYKVDSISEIEKYFDGNLDILDYPVVYILYNNNEIYIGESSDIKNRLLTHSKSDQNKKLKNRLVIFSPFFNKSVALGLETFLLQNFIPVNRKVSNTILNTSKHKYYNKHKYEALFPNIWERLKETKIIDPNLRYDDIKNMDVYKYSPYKELNEDQQNAIITILEGITKGKTSFVVRGLAGTGKTIVAIYLLKLLVSDLSSIDEESLYSEYSKKVYELLKQIKEQKISFNSDNSALVISMKSLRETLGNVFKSIDGLKKKMAVGPSIAIKKKFNLVIVDEAHRLKQCENLSSPSEYKTFKKYNIELGLDEQNGNQLDWLEKSTNIQILFYDKDQTIKKTDVPNTHFEEYFKRNKSVFIDLKQQLRSKGGNLYIDYIDNILNQQVTALEKEEFSEFELKLMPSFKDLVDQIKQKETQVGLSRVIAGFSWKWDSKDDKNIMDINVDGIDYQWNNTDQDWINSNNAINEIGCIHTTQGYDLNYVGLVFGKEIYLDPKDGIIKINRDFYFDVKGKNKTTDIELKHFIINIYKNMMYRGIYGVYIYCMDKNLQDYMKQFISY
ncbi:DNA/RNA helicase domain-containing protein [Myroides profundi]|nr:DNA/RNA helicase domain-containing protein [Myroides profundi]AJH14531.1 hypothetical protein MPR_1349 [Myroides profundi]